MFVINKIFATNKILITYKIFTVNEINNIKNSDKLIKKFIKPKIRKLFKSGKLKSKKLAKFKKLSKVEIHLILILKKLD